jgi:purine-nucleoside phosphorylase
MPGDPARAKWAAETFLTDAKCAMKCGMFDLLDVWNGNVTIQGSAGMPSMSIYAND